MHFQVLFSIYRSFIYFGLNKCQNPFFRTCPRKKGLKAFAIAAINRIYFISCLNKIQICGLLYSIQCRINLFLAYNQDLGTMNGIVFSGYIYSIRTRRQILDLNSLYRF